MRDKHMSDKDKVRMIQNELEHMAQKANELAGRISTEGIKPLSTDDKALCRQALQPLMDECTEMIQFFMIKGNTQRAELETDRLWNLYIK